MRGELRGSRQEGLKQGALSKNPQESSVATAEGEGLSSPPSLPSQGCADHERDLGRTEGNRGHLVLLFKGHLKGKARLTWCQSASDLLSQVGM